MDDDTMDADFVQAGERARRALDLAKAVQDEKDTTPPPAGRSPAEMRGSLDELIRTLSPKAKKAFSGISSDAVRQVCALINALGTRGFEDEDWMVFYLLVRYGHRVTPLQVREAVHVLGQEADVFVLGWVQGHHQQNTGAKDFIHALWEYEARMRLTDRGQRMVRRIMGIEDPRLAGGISRTRARD